MRALSNVIQPTTIDRCTNPLPPLLKLDPQNLCFGDTYLVCTNKEADFGKKENGRGNDGGGGIQVVSIFEQFSVTVHHTHKLILPHQYVKSVQKEIVLPWSNSLSLL